MTRDLAPSLCETARASAYFTAGALSGVWAEGEVPLCLVLGPNGGGKSFFRRLVHRALQRDHPGVEFMGPSMELRTSSPATFRMVAWGSELDSSTGSLSGHAVTVGIKTCLSRTADHVIYWDEPDIGMGEGEAAGCGEVLREFVEQLTDWTRAVFVTSHSRYLVRELAPLRPHYMYLGDVETAPPTLDAWLVRPVRPVRPEQLREDTLRRWRAIQTILNKRGK